MNDIQKVIEFFNDEISQYRESLDGNNGDLLRIAAEECDFEGRIVKFKAAIVALQEKQHNDDLRKRGRLVELPCDIGARVYKVYQFCGAGAWEIEVHKIKLEDLPEIGKTIFLTRKDAQAVVEKMEQKRSLLEAQDD